MKKPLIFVGATMFVAGFVVGDATAIVRTKRKLFALTPLLQSCIYNIMEKAADGELTSEELREEVTVELNFLQLALRGRNGSTP